ncbi:MAG: hypothetical protein U0168_19320 [Nannocystaceae bacterium]
MGRAASILATVVLVGCGADAPERDPFGASGMVTTAPGGASASADDGPVGEASDEGGSSEGGEAGSSGAATSGGDAPGSEIAIVARPASITDQGGGIWRVGESAMDDVGKAFYAAYPDDYDFLVVYTAGDDDTLGAYAHAVQDDAHGIGLDGYGPAPYSPADAGSAGRLRQINFMNTPALYDDGHDASIVIHETIHHFSAYIELPGTPTEAFLLDDGWAHWNIHVNTGGPSATGYGDLVDLGGGRFAFTVMYPLTVSPLELYLAGWLPPQEVGPMFYVRDASDYDPPAPRFDAPWRQGSYGQDASFSGTRVDFTIDDVIAANGPRTPAFGEAPSDFRFAFVLVCETVDSCDPQALAVVEAQRAAMATQFGDATGGRASADTRL